MENIYWMILDKSGSMDVIDQTRTTAVIGASA
jgi:hypothetical protein